MMFKNSMKLLMANFSTVWKMILYYVIVSALIFGLIYPVSNALIAGLNNSGDLTNLLNCATSFNASSNIVALLNDLFIGFNGLFSALFALFSSNTLVAIYACFIVFYFGPFLYSLANLPLQETMFGYMSSLTKYGFTHSYIRKFGKSALLQLFRNLITLPINLLFLYVFVKTLDLTTIGGVMNYFLPIIIVVVMCLLASLKITFLSGWTPACVVYNCNLFAGLGKGFVAVFRRFLKAFSTAFVMMLIIFAVNYLFGIFTFLILIPVSVMLLNIFEMVMFFGSQGMRYYVDLDTIVTPKKLEEKDNFRKLKNVI